MSSRRSRVATTAGAVVVAVSLLFGALGVLVPTRSGAADPLDEAAAHAGADWLKSQQQSDGGFELAGFPGFETADAVLAIASAAQTGSTWSTAEALAAIEALQLGGSGGPTPIDALDDWVTSPTFNAGEAAKVIVLVVAPLGLDPTDFGPSHTDLAALVYPTGCDDPPATDGLFYLEQLFVGLAGELLCGASDPAVVELVRATQRPEGGWNFNGSTDPVDPDDPFDPDQPDVDATALAMQVLIAGGATWDDPSVLAGLAYLAGQQQSSGAFASFGADDPNATAVAMLAITAAGFDPDTSCWRDVAVPTALGTPYASPAAWLRAQQQPDGRFASPNDGFGVNTFATSQAVQGLLRAWLPIVRADGPPTCPVPPAPPTVGGVVAEPPADPVELVARFTG